MTGESSQARGSEITHETTREAASPRTRQASGQARTAQASRMPNLEVDLEDPTALVVAPTTLSVPGLIMARFRRAVRHGAYTEMVLDALRACAPRLPDLVRQARPGPSPGDLFPHRARKASPRGRPEPLRIRPLTGELRIMDAITQWADREVNGTRIGGRRVTRSEVVAVALDAYLPDGGDAADGMPPSQSPA